MQERPALKAKAAAAARLISEQTGVAPATVMTEEDNAMLEMGGEQPFAQQLLTGLRRVLDTMIRFNGTDKPTPENQDLLCDPVVDMDPTARLALGWSLAKVRERFGWVLAKVRVDPERIAALQDAGFPVHEMLDWYETNKSNLHHP